MSRERLPIQPGRSFTSFFVFCPERPFPKLKCSPDQGVFVVGTLLICWWEVLWYTGQKTEEEVELACTSDEISRLYAFVSTLDVFISFIKGMKYYTPVIPENKTWPMDSQVFTDQATPNSSQSKGEFQCILSSVCFISLFTAIVTKFRWRLWPRFTGMNSSWKLQTTWVRFYTKFQWSGIFWCPSGEWKCFISLKFNNFNIYFIAFNSNLCFEITITQNDHLCHTDLM